MVEQYVSNGRFRHKLMAVRQARMNIGSIVAVVIVVVVCMELSVMHSAHIQKILHIFFLPSFYPQSFLTSQT